MTRSSRLKVEQKLIQLDQLGEDLRSESNLKKELPLLTLPTCPHRMGSLLIPPDHPSSPVSSSSSFDSHPMDPTCVLSMPTPRHVVVSPLSISSQSPDPLTNKLTHPEPSLLVHDYESKLVVNLSSAPLSPPTFNFLKRGLDFALSPWVILRVPLRN